MPARARRATSAGACGHCQRAVLQPPQHTLLPLPAAAFSKRMRHCASAPPHASHKAYVSHIALLGDHRHGLVQAGPAPVPEHDAAHHHDD